MSNRTFYQGGALAALARASAAAVVGGVLGVVLAWLFFWLLLVACGVAS